MKRSAPTRVEEEGRGYRPGERDARRQAAIAGVEMDIVAQVIHDRFAEAVPTRALQQRKITLSNQVLRVNAFASERDALILKRGKGIGCLAVNRLERVYR